MNESCKASKIVGDKLHLSSGCLPDKSNSLAYSNTEGGYGQNRCLTFLVNVSPVKRFDVANSNFAGA